MSQKNKPTRQWVMKSEALEIAGLSQYSQLDEIVKRYDVPTDESTTGGRTTFIYLPTLKRAIIAHRLNPDVARDVLEDAAIVIDALLPGASGHQIRSDAQSTLNRIKDLLGME